MRNRKSDISKAILNRTLVRIQNLNPKFHNGNRFLLYFDNDTSIAITGVTEYISNKRRNEQINEDIKSGKIIMKPYTPRKKNPPYPITDILPLGR